MAAVTRLGLHGGPRPLYGSFAGKIEQVIVEAPSLGAGGAQLRPSRAFGAERTRDELMRLFGIEPEVAKEVAEQVEIRAEDLPDLTTMRDLAELTGVAKELAESADMLTQRINQLVAASEATRQAQLQEMAEAANDDLLLLLLA